MFPIVGDASTRPDRLPDLSRFDVLVEDKVWQHLGLTLKEFLAQEAEGAYADDRRPEVVALMNLMCTGAWQVAGRTGPRDRTSARLGLRCSIAGRGGRSARLGSGRCPRGS
jgi:hypothetical protein